MIDTKPRNLVCALLGTLAAVASAGGEEGVFRNITEFDFRLPSPTISGVWESRIDRSLDGKVKEASTTRWTITSKNNRLSGRAAAKPDDKNASPILVGELVSGTPFLVTVREDDQQGVTRIFTGKLVAPKQITGTYTDNRGNTGDWILSMIAERTFEPAPIPDAQLYRSVLGIYGKAIRGKRHPFINLRPPNRDLWADDIKARLEPTLPYGDVDYIATALLVIEKTGTYHIDLPDSGVQFRLNGHLVKGDVLLERGAYDIEIYTNHWGQPYLKYAHVAIIDKATEKAIPLVNTKAAIAAFRARKIGDDSVAEVTDFKPEPWRHSE